MADQTVIAPDVPMTTNNLAVQAIDERIYRVVKELARMVSARMTAITEDDKTRMDAHFAWILRVIETATASTSDFHYLATMPLRDLNEASGRIENPAMQTAMYQLIGADVNLRISPSGRGNDALTPQDKADLVQAVNKSKTYIDDFFAQDNPLDLNQSAPDQDVVAPMQMPG